MPNGWDKSNSIIPDCTVHRYDLSRWELGVRAWNYSGTWDIIMRDLCEANFVAFADYLSYALGREL